MTENPDPQMQRDGSLCTLFSPSELCRRWLLIGMIALVIDLVLGIASTVLEFQHWGQEGFTSGVVIAYAAIVPEMFVVAAYLVVAQEAGTRGLWKSAAGMLGSYILFCTFGLVMLEVLSVAGSIAIIILVAAGILGLLAFSISGIPRFLERSDSFCYAEESVNDTVSSGGPGWLGGFAIFGVFVVLRLLFRAGLDIDDWQLIELFAVIAFGLSFAIWFAVTKIRHRRRLGGMASVIGWTEILILLIHLGMALAILAVLINETEVNPLLDDDGVDQVLDPWMRRASLISAVSHGVWAILTAVFFSGIRGRTQRVVDYKCNALAKP